MNILNKHGEVIFTLDADDLRNADLSGANLSFCQFIWC